MYTITIEKLEVTEREGKEQRIVDERPYTDEELAQANTYYQSKAEKGEQDLKKIYDYVTVKKRDEKWIKVYHQAFESLNVSDVVKAALESSELARKRNNEQR